MYKNVYFGGIMSKLSERLNELVSERNKTCTQISKELGIDRSTLYTFMHGKALPSMRNLVKLADYFNCSSDFLLGYVDYDKPDKVFKACPPFSERLAFLLKYFGKTKTDLTEEANITESIIFQWQDGTYEPSLDNILKLKNYFDCSVDFILGREG